MRKVFAAHGLTLFDVEELPTHGGSLRIYARHDADASKPVGERVGAICSRARRRPGSSSLETYRSFAERVQRGQARAPALPDRGQGRGQAVAGYGAPAKGNTLLNYCGVRTDFLDYTVDRSPHKQGRYLPGTRIPIHAPGPICARPGRTTCSSCPGT